MAHTCPKFDRPLEQAFASNKADKKLSKPPFLHRPDLDPALPTYLPEKPQESPVIYVPTWKRTCPKNAPRSPKIGTNMPFDRALEQAFASNKNKKPQ